MIARRSSPCSFPATNCLLIVLIAPCRRCDRYQLLYHLGAFQLSFFSFFPPFFSTLSKGYATLFPRPPAHGDDLGHPAFAQKPQAFPFKSLHTHRNAWPIEHPGRVRAIRRTRLERTAPNPSSLALSGFSSTLLSQ